MRKLVRSMVLAVAVAGVGWQGQVALWQSLYFGYALCTDVGAGGPTELVWQRAVESLGRAILEHGWGYRGVPALLWKELNSCYRTAESCVL